MFQVSPGVNISEIDLTTVVPGVSSTTGAIAGVFRWGPVNERVLIDTETNLASTFGKPTSLNPETFMTAASFLAYGSALYVARAANTTAGNANAAVNAMANSAAAAVANCVVLNRTDYEARTSFEANAMYVAKYPGALGNSLKISVCDSTNAYQSNVNMIVLGANAANASASLAIGANTLTFSFSAASAADANNLAANIVSSFVVGDMVKIGNSQIGNQFLRVTAITNYSNSTVANVYISLADKYRLSTDFVANTTVNGNTTVVGLQRNWEYFNVVDGAPVQSAYQLQSGNTSALDTLHVVIVDEDGLFAGVPGGVLEVYENVSRATDAKTTDGAALYYKTVINNGSRYAWYFNDRSGAVSNTALNLASSTNVTPLTLSFNSGTDGYTEATAPLNILANAYDLFVSPEEVDISLILQGKPVGGSTTVNGQTVEDFQLANYLIDNIATIRKDCVVFVTPDDALVQANAGAEAQSIVNWRGALTDSSYAVIDSGYKYMYDRYNDAYRYVPSNGDVAGLCARTDQTNDSWWSPAGFNRGQIKNVVKLRFNPSKAERDLLYKNSVNPLVSFPGQGTVLYGDKTGTTKPSAFGHINVRRLFITLEKAISQVAKYSLFEFNDDFTRSQFRSLITSYLRDIQARRGVTDFLVVCDTTNNTSDRIDRGEFWGDIYIKPNRSINYIQLNFVAVRTGVQFSTIVGQFG